MEPTFLLDSDIGKVSQAYAEDAVELAAKTFQTRLDWTDESIAFVESILSKLNQSLPNPRPPNDAIWNFAKGFGSYVGEVFRKNHGGEWGTITDGDKSFPGMRGKAGVLFWPWGRAFERIVNGEENNVLHYYQKLVAS